MNDREMTGNDRDPCFAAGGDRREYWQYCKWKRVWDIGISEYADGGGGGSEGRLPFRVIV